MVHCLSGYWNFKMTIIKLKGGSLNSTSLHIDGDRKFVRKFIATSADREYGYVRWYSQLKKIQRYNSLFPNLFPKLHDVNITENGAYFDIEYIENSKDIKTLFVNGELSDDQVQELNKNLWTSFDRIHDQTYDHNPSSLRLYYKEEVEQKLNDALQFQEFKDFFNYDEYVYNNVKIPNIKQKLDEFKKLFDTPIDSECYVHGNPTLENIMYSTTTGKITFIDLYEEGIVDSKFMDYSQILQCSNSYYGVYNDFGVLVHDNSVSCTAQIPAKLKKFNDLFVNEITKRYGEEKLRLVQLFEATQFFRMLPFKCHAGNIDSAKFFYAHACFLVNKLL